jgi:hypothetical protein
MRYNASMEAGEREEAIALAVALNAVKRCSVCGAPLDTGEFYADDDDGIREVVEPLFEHSADVIGPFEDIDTAVKAVLWAMGEAGSEPCLHSDG